MKLKFGIIKKIDYIYKSTLAGTRTGIITLVVDPTNDTYILSDDYNFTGDVANAEKLKFTAQNYDDVYYSNKNEYVDTTTTLQNNLIEPNTYVTNNYYTVDYFDYYTDYELRINRFYHPNYFGYSYFPYNYWYPIYIKKE